MGKIRNYINRILSQREATPAVAAANARYAEEHSPFRCGDTLNGINLDALLGSTEPALCVSTAYRCTKLLSDSVAQLPLVYMRLRDGYYQQDETPEGANLNALIGVQPDDEYTAVDFWSTIVQDMITHGNAYAVPVRIGAGSIYRFALCRPWNVSHDTNNDTYTISDAQAGISGTYDSDEVLHFKWASDLINPKRGAGVLAFARQSTEAARTGDRESVRRMLTGGMRGIISTETQGRGLADFDPTEMEKFANRMNERLNGGNSGFTAVPFQTAVHQLSQTSADMQFLETRKFTVREICRFYGVHPSFVFDDTSNNYKSAEMANVAFLSNTLNPILCRIENELRRKLVPRSLWSKRKFEFSRRGVYSLDMESRTKYYMQMISAGAMTVNEVRKLENMPAVEGGDRVMVSANLKGIDEGTNNNDNNNYNETDNKA